MSIAELIFCTALVFGPIIGYIAQYQEIQSSGDPSGFSTLVCFILIVSNILRVFFWFLKRFEVSLLAQSIVMVVAQLALLELIVRVKLRNHPSKNQTYNYDLTRGFTFGKFWKWDYFGQYVSFVVTFLVAGASVAILNYAIFHSSLLTEAIGSLALLIESTLAMPQCYQNWRAKSCRGLRKELVLTWFAGDAFKTAFFITRRAPPQFILCGVIQLIVDVLITIQMRVYNSPDVAPHLQPSRSKRTPEALSSTSIFKEDAEYEFAELGKGRGEEVGKFNESGEEDRRTTIETAFLADPLCTRDHSNKALYGTF